MLSRERPRTSAIAMQMPTLLPRMRDALARRAAVFGPYDPDTTPVAPRGLLARCAAAMRAAADFLKPAA